MGGGSRKQQGDGSGTIIGEDFTPDKEVRQELDQLLQALESAANEDDLMAAMKVLPTSKRSAGEAWELQFAQMCLGMPVAMVVSWEQNNPRPQGPQRTEALRLRHTDCSIKVPA